MSKKSRQKQEEQKKLEAHYELLRERREAIAERERPFLDRLKAIMDAPRFATVDFWCTQCKKDCTGMGYRQVCTILPKYPTAWFLGFCSKGHRMIRRITDKDRDPYYFQSLFLMRQRSEMELDLLTPDDPRFKTLYPKQWEELYGKQQKKSEN